MYEKFSKFKIKTSIRYMPRGGYSRQKKLNIERVLAAAFTVQKIGYGFAVNYAVLKHRHIQISHRTYANLMTAVIRAVYRKIENFLKNDRIKQIKPISVEQFFMIRAALLQVREWLDKDLLQIFFKFVRLTYKLVGDTQISMDEARRLHSKLMFILQKHIKVNIHTFNQKNPGKIFKNNAFLYVSYRFYDKPF